MVLLRHITWYLKLVFVPGIIYGVYENFTADFIGRPHQSYMFDPKKNILEKFSKMIRFIIYTVLYRGYYIILAKKCFSFLNEQLKHFNINNAV